VGNLSKYKWNYYVDPEPITEAERLRRKDFYTWLLTLQPFHEILPHKR
jgi:hypothetical protein